MRQADGAPLWLKRTGHVAPASGAQEESASRHNEPQPEAAKLRLQPTHPHNKRRATGWTQKKKSK